MKTDDDSFKMSSLSSESISRVLRNLPARVPPRELATSLRVIASRERQRQFQRRDFPARLALWRDRFDLMRGQFLRSLALPFAGGVFSTVILFSMFIVPVYPLFSSGTLDVDTMLTTGATVKGLSP